MTDEHWEEEAVDHAKPVGIVVSVRFPRDVAEQIQAVAKRRSVSMSTVVRDAVEAFLDAPERSLATAGLTVSVAEGSVSFVSGTTHAGQSIGVGSRDLTLQT